MNVPAPITIPTGPVYGKLRLEWLGPTGRVRSQVWPAREWKSVGLAMEVGHRMNATYYFAGTYAVELEIIRIPRAE